MKVPIEAHAILHYIQPDMVDLYLPKTKWRKILRENKGSNRLTVVLRFKE